MAQKMLVLLGLLLMCVAPAFADEKEKNQLTVEIATNVWSKYLNQAGEVAYDGPVLWSSIFVTHNPTGLFVGLWNSVPIDGSRLDSNFGTENNIFLGWRSGTGDVGYEVGVAYFDLYKIGGDARGDLMQAWGEVNYTFTRGAHEFVPFARIEYVMPPPLSNTELNSSLRALIGTGYSFKLDERTSLLGKLWLIGDDGRNSPEPAVIGQLDLGIRYTVTKNLSANLGIRLSRPITRTEDRGFEAVPSVGLSLRF